MPEAATYERWQKVCDCVATATTNRIVFGRSEDKGDNYTVLVTFYPGPVCNRCDEPWVRTDER